MTPSLSFLKGVCKINHPFYITVPTGNAVLVEKMGYVELDKNIKLSNVLFVHQFSCNLISMHKLSCDSNCTLTYDENCCTLQDWTTKRLIGLGDLHGGVYEFKGQMQGLSYNARQHNAASL